MKLTGRNFLLVGAIALAVGRFAAAVDVYTNDFNAEPGTRFSEWKSSVIRYKSAADPPGSGAVDAQVVASCEAPNGAQRFLGEFGGPKFGTPADPGFNRTLVDQTIMLAIDDLPPHEALRLEFDLYVLKSWDGNSPQYGSDRLKLAVAGGPVLLDTSFSNNHKVDRQSSYQDYPQPKSTPQTSAVATNTLGYDFFGDAIYYFEFEFPHRGAKLELQFTSSLFEGKGTADESWGLDNVRLETTEVTAE
jgi:hypothetical protein